MSVFPSSISAYSPLTLTEGYLRIRQYEVYKQSRSGI